MKTSMTKKHLVVLIATYRRRNELKRCLDCLERQTHPPDQVVVLDNAAEADIKTLVESFGARFHYLPLPVNLGCSAALKTGEEYAFKEWGEQLSHFWIMDDDAAPEPHTLEQLLDADRQTTAAIITPICTTPAGELFGLPDAVKPVPRKIRKAFRSSRDVQNYFGVQLVPIYWCTGVSCLVKSRAVKESGLHRDDFWMQGDDLEFSMRICRQYGGVLVPWVVTPHLYPATGKGSESAHIKACSLLQNTTYLGAHEIRTWRTFYYIFANLWRFFKELGVNAHTVRYGLRAMFNGAILAEPAGRDSGARLRQQLARDFTGIN
jgi:GT2 family glycosyltransferase